MFWSFGWDTGGIDQSWTKGLYPLTSRKGAEANKQIMETVRQWQWGELDLMKALAATL